MSFTSKQLGSNRIYSGGNCPPNIINISNLIDKCVKQVGVDDYTLKVETTATVGTIVVEDKSTSDEIVKVVDGITNLDGNIQTELGKVTSAIGNLENGFGFNTDDSITGKIEQLIGINKVTTDEGEIITNTDLILKLTKQKEVTGDSFPTGTIYELQETLNSNRHTEHLNKIGDSVSAINTLETNSGTRHAEHLNKIGDSVSAINTLETNSGTRHTEHLNKIGDSVSAINTLETNSGTRHTEQLNKIGDSVSAINTLETNSGTRHTEHLNKIGDSVSAINTLESNSGTRHTEQLAKLEEQITKLTNVDENSDTRAATKELNDNLRHQTLVSNLHPFANTSLLRWTGELDLDENGNELTTGGSSNFIGLRSLKGRLPEDSEINPKTKIFSNYFYGALRGPRGDWWQLGFENEPIPRTSEYINLTITGRSTGHIPRFVITAIFNEDEAINYTLLGNNNISFSGNGSSRIELLSSNEIKEIYDPFGEVTQEWIDASDTQRKNDFWNQLEDGPTEDTSTDPSTWSGNPYGLFTWETSDGQIKLTKDERNTSIDPRWPYSILRIVIKNKGYAKLNLRLLPNQNDILQAGTILDSELISFAGIVKNSDNEVSGYDNKRIFPDGCISYDTNINEYILNTKIIFGPYLMPMCSNREGGPDCWRITDSNGDQIYPRTGDNDHRKNTNRKNGGLDAYQFNFDEYLIYNKAIRIKKVKRLDTLVAKQNYSNSSNGGWDFTNTGTGGTNNPYKTEVIWQCNALQEEIPVDGKGINATYTPFYSSTAFLPPDQDSAVGDEKLLSTEAKKIIDAAALNDSGITDDKFRVFGQVDPYSLSRKGVPNNIVKRNGSVVIREQYHPGKNNYIYYLKFMSETNTNKVLVLNGLGDKARDDIKVLIDKSKIGPTETIVENNGAGAVSTKIQLSATSDNASTNIHDYDFPDNKSHSFRISYYAHISY